MGRSMRSSRPWGYALILWECLIVFPLALASGSLAAEKTSDYLIVLDHSDPEFAAVLRGAGTEPLSHSDTRWLAKLKPSQVADIKQLPSVKQVLPAACVVLEIDPRVADLPSKIDRAGGIVVQKYENTPVLSVVVPQSSLSQLQQLTGVKRVRKQRTFAATER
jgi:hypothetical protein